MCCRCSAAEWRIDLLHRRPVAVDERRGVRPRAKSKNAASRISAALTASVKPAAPVAIGQGRQEREVVDDRERRRERAEVVLLPERVDAVLHADRGVVLREHGRRHANQPNAAMRGRGRKADDVEHGAAADRDDVRMPAERRGMDGLEQPFDLCRIVLGLLASRNDQRPARPARRPTDVR